MAICRADEGDRANSYASAVYIFTEEENGDEAEKQMLGRDSTDNECIQYLI